jgi:hypothetical protein
MFEIPIWDLLNSYSWDSQDLEFNWEVYSWFYEDIEFLGNLYLKLKLINLDSWIMAIIEKLEAEVKYEWKSKKILLEKIEREFKEKFDPADPDDIKYINTKNSTINLKDIIREEILIQF